ncbi:hypothetical protein [Helicobacter brantae]|uniref:Outer membrane beta-barrel protein n=1 Tax=Helicobacter brantae TaxID=375927 RepID=A0A3D8J2S1_9HELI|nr:hypothetical protein [Helicobacter brantae]RDU71817.1 hypothetical protein CQA58_01890 [Helicobacter brantae]
MKKILLILTLLLSCVWSEESEDSQWRTFIGIEGGVGLYSIFPSAFVNFNYHLSGVKAYANSLGYNLALQIGWQKYTSENFGKRFILSLRGDYMQDYGKYKNGDKQFPLGNGYGFMLSFDTDWLFDFSVQGKNRYGMFAGIGIDVLGLDWFQKVSGRLGIFASLVARVGFKTQIENNVIDLTLNIPMVGLMSGGNFATNGGDFLNAPINSTLTLGYKYLF